MPYIFKPCIYDTMLENDETWFSDEHGNAVLILDCQLLDC